MKRASIVAAVALFAGCITNSSAVVNTISRATFAPEEKRQVWGRALDYFQSTNTMISAADVTSGFLRSERQPSTFRCSAFANGVAVSSCPCHEVIQFTLSDDGTALLRTNRSIFGEVKMGHDLVSEDDIKATQREQDLALSKIVSAEASPAPPRASSIDLERPIAE
jgi:hypothetical protein